MTYSVAVPLGGHAGWAFLQRTRDQQQAAHSADAAQARKTRYFTDRIAQVATAEQLIADRTLREVALGAFGLDDDLDNRAFLTAIMASNTYDPGALTGRLTDKRYLALARTFGFGDLGGARTADPGFARRIVDAYEDRQFEISVGETDPDFRLALGLERELQLVNDRTMSDDARWYTVMATPPLRKVFEAALGLPESFGALDIDRQLGEFRSRAKARLGSGDVKDFSDPALRDKLVSQFLTGAQVRSLSANTVGPARIALTLLASG